MDKRMNGPTAISEEIWDMKYRLKAADGTPLDTSIADTWLRVARTAAKAEKTGERAHWRDRFLDAMADFAFLPAGRILAGAGARRATTLFNCFVMGTIADDLGSIFDNVKEAALTLQQGGGIGHDFSTLRPKGALVRSIGADASGPVSFMDVWDAMCRTIMSAGARRGAMMGTLRCDHPDIEAFVDAKADPTRLRMFNLSVLVTDAFMQAIAEDEDWPLVFEGEIWRTLRARDLWDRIMRAAYDYAEPGVIFIDRVNAANTLSYCETIHATNPCGEEPLPPYGACLLGSINLARLVRRPFEPGAHLDIARLEELVRIAVRLLDDVIDVSRYPLRRQKREALAKRRIGLGLTGLADALVMCNLPYASRKGVIEAERWMAAIQRAGYLVSTELAREKGAFPLFEREPFLAAPGVARLDTEVRKAIARHGMRNGLITAIAPTGTISLLAGNLSSGIEPIFDYIYRRRVLLANGGTQEDVVEDHAYALFRRMHGPDAPLPKAFVRATDLTPEAHLGMQATLQRHIDGAISKTINCPEDMPFEAFRDIYTRAHALGLKGCTTYRPNPITGAVLTRDEAPACDAVACEMANNGARAAGSRAAHRASVSGSGVSGGRGSGGGGAHPVPARLAASCCGDETISILTIPHSAL